jgi:hypothetical protein
MGQDEGDAGDKFQLFFIHILIFLRVHGDLGGRVTDTAGMGATKWVASQFE